MVCATTVLLVMVIVSVYASYIHSCQLAKNKTRDKQLFLLIIYEFDAILRFAAVTLMIQVYIIHIVCGKKTKTSS